MHPKSWTKNPTLMKYPFEIKLSIVQKVLSGSSKLSVCRSYGICPHELRLWVMLYKEYGREGLLPREPYKHSTEEKIEAVYLHREKKLSLVRISCLYRVSRFTIMQWLQKYDGYVLSHPRTGSTVRSDSAENPRKMVKYRKKEPKTEVERLQQELLRLRAENALLKKLQALVEEKRALARRSGLPPSED